MKRHSLHSLLLALIVTLALLVFSVPDAYSQELILPSQTSTSAADTGHHILLAQNDDYKSVKTKILEAGARLLQDTTPVNQLQMYLDGFHNYKSQANLPGEQQQQMRVAHYCQQMNEDFIQCAIFDGNTFDAHLIGIEHIVSDKVYGTLPDAEKQYWHPHDGEVDSGMLLAPSIPEPANKVLMDTVRTTYGKTWHVWDTHTDRLPFGEPRLMWAIEPNQINAQTKSQMTARQQSVKFSEKND